MHFLFDLFLFRFVGLDSICEEFRELGIWLEKYRLCFETLKRHVKEKEFEVGNELDEKSEHGGLLTN